MPEIMTVLGPIAPGELGFTSMHEHVLYDGHCFRRRFGNLIPPNPPVKVIPASARTAGAPKSPTTPTPTPASTRR